MFKNKKISFSLNIFYFIIRNGIGQKLYNIMIALSLNHIIYVKLAHELYLLLTIIKSINLILKIYQTVHYELFYSLIPHPYPNLVYKIVPIFSKMEIGISIIKVLP